MAEVQSKSRSNVAELTVSELANAIKAALEDGFGYVRLRGEISGFRGPHSSGHCYFALKDDKAKIEAVIWRSSYGRLKVKPEEGLEVIATGRITTFPGKSTYQIVIDALEPAGVGALMALLEERKKRLAGEGLFDDSRKRPLPFLPRIIGIVTSPTGAVIRDMLHGFAERFPVRVMVWPVRVQGETCAAEVAAAIRGFNALPPEGALPRPDVLIVARGGGSLEDLWGFNDEAVVRAAAASAIPIVSAVGHETDWTLIDLVADARAPTPTKAAEWVVPKHADLVEQTGKLALRLSVATRRYVDGRRTALKAVARGLPRPSDLVALPRQRLDGADSKLGLHFKALVGARRARLGTAASRLPRPWSLVRWPRERFSAVEARLGRALHSNTRAHAHALARAAGRLSPRLIANRAERCRDRLDRLERAKTAALTRLAGQRRLAFERTASRLTDRTARRRIGDGVQRLEYLSTRMTQAFFTSIRAERRRLGSLGQLLRSLGYQSVLARGFALVRDAQGRPVRSATGVGLGDRIDIEVADGRIGATVDTSAPTAKPAAAQTVTTPPARSQSPRPRKDGGSGGNGGQGSLF